MAFPGAERTKRQWQDEEHARYIDSGGYDRRAGWKTTYKLSQPTTMSELLDFYERVLSSGGWRVALREELPGRTSLGRLRLVKGSENRSRQIDVEASGPAQADLGEGRQLVTGYTLEYLLPYDRAPKYDD